MLCKRFRKIGFKGKLWLSVMAILLASFAMAGMTIQIVNEKNLERLLIDKNKTILYQTANAIDVLFAKIDQVALQYSIHPMVEQLSGPPASTAKEAMQLGDFLFELKSIKMHEAVVDSVELFYPESRTIISNSVYTLDELRQLERYDYDFFDRLIYSLHDNQLVTRQRQDADRRANEIIVTVPKLFKLNKQTSVYILVNISKRSFERAIGQLLPDAETKYAVRQEGEIVFSNGDAAMGRVRLTETLQSQFIEKQSIGDGHVFVSYSPLYNNLDYLMIAPSQSMASQIHTANKDLFEKLVLVLIVLLLLSRLITNRMYGPVKSLIQYIQSTDSVSSDWRKGSDLEYIRNKIGGLVLEKERLATVLQNNLPYIRRNFMIRLLQGKIPEPDIARRMGAYQIALDRPNVVAVLLKLEEYARSKVSNDEEMENVIRCRLDRVLADERGCPYFIIDLEDDTFALVLAYEGPADSKSLYPLMQRIQAELAVHGLTRVTIGMGGAYGRLGQLPQSFREAKEVLENRYMAGKGEIMFFADLKKTGDSADYPAEEERLAVQAIKNGDRAEIAACIAALYTYMSRTNHRRPRELQFLLAQFAYVLVREVTRGQELEPDFLKFVHAHILEGISEHKSLKEHIDCIEALAYLLMEERQRRAEDKNDEIVRRALDYIDQNFHKNISVEDIAAGVYLSSAHLGKIFKAHTGKTLLEVLTERKIRFAQERLVQSLDPIYQIAEMIGYANVKSFSRMFKNQVGFTPGEFRSRYADTP